MGISAAIEMEENSLMDTAAQRVKELLGRVKNAYRQSGLSTTSTNSQKLDATAVSDLKENRISLSEAGNYATGENVLATAKENDGSVKLESDTASLKRTVGDLEASEKKSREQEFETMVDNGYDSYQSQQLAKGQKALPKEEFAKQARKFVDEAMTDFEIAKQASRVEKGKAELNKTTATLNEVTPTTSSDIKAMLESEKKAGGSLKPSVASSARSM